MPAAFVYESLEQARTRPTSFELAETTGIARSTVYEAPQTLTAFDLVQQHDGRWVLVHTTSLAVLAETLGSAQVVADRLQQHRAERLAYRRVLRIVTPYIETNVPEHLLAGGGRDGETALELLQRLLGARRVA